VFFDSVEGANVLFGHTCLTPKSVVEFKRQSQFSAGRIFKRALVEELTQGPNAKLKKPVRQAMDPPVSFGREPTEFRYRKPLKMLDVMTPLLRTTWAIFTLRGVNLRST
jgi:hypothetical protein